MQQIDYGIKVETDMDFDRAVEKATAELKNEGFGVLTEIDVKATMKKKLDVDVPPYMILGSCNPPYAHQALTAEPDIGLLLPCNVIVYEREGKTIVAALNPEVALSVVNNPALQPLAKEVSARLNRVMDSFRQA